MKPPGPWRPQPDFWDLSGPFWKLPGDAFRVLYVMSAVMSRAGLDALPADPIMLKEELRADMRPARLAEHVERLVSEGYLLLTESGGLRVVWTRADQTRMRRSSVTTKGQTPRTEGVRTAYRGRTEGVPEGATTVRSSYAPRTDELKDSEHLPELPHARAVEERRGEERRERSLAPARETPPPDQVRTCSDSVRQRPTTPDAAPTPLRLESPAASMAGSRASPVEASGRPSLALVREDCRDHARRWLDRLAQELRTARPGRRTRGVLGLAEADHVETDHADRLAELAERDPAAFRAAVDRHIEDARGWTSNALAWLTRGVGFARERLDAPPPSARPKPATIREPTICGPPPLDVESVIPPPHETDPDLWSLANITLEDVQRSRAEAGLPPLIPTEEHLEASRRAEQERAFRESWKRR